MQSPFVRLANLWIRRYARSSPDVRMSLEAVAHLKPITLITGGSRGIGAALALTFAENGHDVAIVARRGDVLDAAAQRISTATGHAVIGLALDVTSPSASADIDRELSQRGYYLDILVNNAAIGFSGRFEDMTAAEADQLVALNIGAPSRLMLHALPAMRARQQGGILNIASLGGYAPGPYQAAYYASKSYILSLTEAVAAETAGHGLRIAVLAPGPVNTRFHASMGAEGARYRRYLPALSAERAARIAYRGFSLGRRVIVPGIFNWLMFAGLKILPHPMTVPVVAWLLAPPKGK